MQHQSLLLSSFTESKDFREAIIIKSRELQPIVLGRLYEVPTLESVRGDHKDCRMSDDFLAYSRFLTLKIVCEDFDSKEMCPSKKVDKIWHAHILGDVAEYIVCCKEFSASDRWVNHKGVVDKDMLRGMSTVRKIIEQNVWPAPPQSAMVTPIVHLTADRHDLPPPPAKRNRDIRFDEATSSTARQGSRDDDPCASTRAPDDVVDLDCDDSNVCEKDDETDEEQAYDEDDGELNCA